RWVAVPQRSGSRSRGAAMNVRKSGPSPDASSRRHSSRTPSNLFEAGAFALPLSLVTGIAAAQAPSQEPRPVEEVVVTGTRIQQTGMVTPTPVTSVGSQDLQAMAPGNLIDSLSQLPQFFNNDTPQTQFNFAGSAGASNLNVRGI